MCLIIHNPKGKKINSDIIDTAFYMNPDGCGVFFHDTKEILKTLDPDEADEWIESRRPFTFHFRYATSGKVDEASCHPFIINDRYALMMNGTIQRLVSKTKVDTMALCEILDGMTHDQMIAVLSTYDARFALIDRVGGKVEIVNRDLWHSKKGVLYSKDNCFLRYSKHTKASSYNTGSFKNDSRFPDYTGGYSSGYGGNCGTGFADDDDDDWASYWLRKEREDEELAAAPELLEAYDYEAMPSDVRQLPTEPTPDTTLVAVYGTLKSGRGNHHLLAESEFIGTGTTLDPYPMVIHGCPFVIDSKDHPKGHHVVVEIYRVGGYDMQRLDSLEGHPDWYQRRVKPMVLDATGGIIEAYIYIIPESASSTVMQADTPTHKCY